MLNLLKVELYKLKKFQFLYLATLFMLVVGYMYGYKIGGSNMTYTTDVAFSETVCDTSFVFLIAIVTVLFIGKDFSNRTICNEIKLGHSRFYILISRMAAVCAFAILLHAAYIISTVIGFSVVRGFDASMLCVKNALWLLTALIQLIAVLSGVVLISFTTRRAPEAIILSAIYAFTGCNILRIFVDSRIFTRSCFYFVQDNSMENLAYAVISAVVTMVIFLTIAVISFSKADIK